MKRFFKITPLVILLFLAGSHKAFSFVPAKSTTGVSTVTKGGSLGIKGFTKHGLNQAINRGVKPGYILDALKSPLQTRKVVIDSLGRPSQRIIGRYAEVVINPKTGQVLSVNPTSTKKAQKLLELMGR